MDLSINAVFVHEGAQVTIALLLLNFFELLHDVVGAFLEAHVTCGGPHEAHSGQVVSCNEPHVRSEEHTSELQSQSNLVCRLLLEKKKTMKLPQANVHTTHTQST